MRTGRFAPAVKSLLMAMVAALALLPAAPASPAPIVRDRLPRDDWALDLILRSSRDPDLLSSREIALQARLVRMGVDPLNMSGRPSLSTALSGWLGARTGVDPERPPRTRVETYWDRRSGLVATFEVPEDALFKDVVDTNLLGMVLRTSPDLDQPGVLVRLDRLDNFIRAGVVRGLEEDLAMTLRNRQAAQSGSGELLNFTLPIRLPRSLERVIGKGEATSIRISGTQQISIGGQSTVSDNFVASELRQSQSLFPQLEFTQTLRVNLDGTVGEKIKVRISHDSQAVGRNGTEVKISFEGDEDDIIRAIRAGDIDVTLPGSRLLGVGSGRGGLFGLKVEGGLGPVEFTVVGSKENAQQGNQTFSQSGGSEELFEIRSVDYERARFFRLTAPVSFYFADPDSFPVPLQDGSLADVVSEQNPGARWRIDYTSLEVYRSIGSGISQEGTIEDAVAYVDTSGLGFEGFGDGAGLTPGDSGPTGGDPLESGFDPALALDLPFQARERWERLETPEAWELLEVNGQVIGLRLQREATTTEVIGVSYNIVDAVTGELVRRVGRSSRDVNPTIDDPLNPGTQIHYFKLLKPAEAGQPFENGDFTEFALCWEYEYRNFYDLVGRDIDPGRIEFKINRNDSTLDPPDIDPDTSLRFIRIFGLDQQSQTGELIPDNLADVQDQNIFYLQPGFLRFPNPTPMNLPEDVLSGYTGGVIADIPRAPTLYTRDLTSDQLRQIDFFRFTIRQNSVSSRLSLNAFNILEGSEEVLLDGELQKRGVDYDIDYLTGEVNLKGDALAKLNTQTKIEVRFENDPLFGGGRTSLSGMNLTWRFGTSNLLSTTWLYQTRPNNQTKIRLGEEPRRNLTGNLQTKLRFQPGWMRTLGSWMSLQTVEKDASVDLDAEVAMSVPNPNTRDTAYLDDFEGADQSTQIPMSRQGWWWASLPVRGPDPDDPGQTPRKAYQPEDRAYAGWHRAVPSVKRSDLNPELSEAESRDIFTTLELRVAAQDTLAGWRPDEFAGMMRGLGEVDLSRAQFLEFWVDDGTGYIDPSDSTLVKAKRPGKLHFDFGQINEDFFWPRDADGTYITGGWDKEDSDNDGLLGLAEDGQTEDRGLDRLLDSEESALGAMPGRPSRGGEDPAGDGFDVVDDQSNTFIYINGTENNQRLDSEDISFNNALDLSDGFFRLSLDLDDTDAFVDPARDYSDNLEFIAGMQRDGRSWRKYRLDLRNIVALRRGIDDAEPLAYSPATPDLSRVRYLRIWYEPESGRPDESVRRIRFAEMRFLGNRWRTDGIRDVYDTVIDTLSTQEFRLGVLNNKENPDYIPPFPVRVRNNVVELEQSLQFLYTDLEPGERFRVRKDLPGRIGEDYLDYGELNFFWRVPYRDGFPDPTQTEAEGYFWIGTDSTSYYEISVPFDRVTAQSTGWVEVSVSLADLSNIKNAAADSLVRYPDAGSGRLNPQVTRGVIRDTETGNVYDATVRGRPDLGRVQRYYAGVRYRQPPPGGPAPPAYTGEVLFNELRLLKVNRRTGFAQRYSARAQVPGVGDLSVEFSRTDAEFRGIDRQRGAGVNRTNWAMRGSTRLQNFIPLGPLDIPIQLSQRSSEDLPKFEPRSDIELLDKDTQRRFSTRTDAQSFSIQFRKPTQSPHWWLQYTLDPFAYQMSGSRNQRTSPERESRQESLDWSYRYDLNLRKVPSLPLPLTAARFTWLPTQVTLGSRWRFDRQEVTAKNLSGQPIDTTVQRTRVMANDATLRWRPFESLPTTWTLSSTRNLLLAENPVYSAALGDGRLWGLNVGFEERRREGLSFQYRPSFRWLNWMRPNVELRTSYGENRAPGIRQRAALVGDAILDPDGDGQIGVPTEVRNLTNNRDVTFRAELGLVGWLKRVLKYEGAGGRGRLRQAAAADSTGEGESGPGVGAVFARMFSGLSRGFWDMEAVSLNYTDKRNSSYQHVNGRAPWLYRLGIATKPDFSSIEPLPIRFDGSDVVYQDFSVDQRRKQRNLRLNTRTKLAEPLRLDMGFAWRRNELDSATRGATFDRSRDWPDLTLRISRVHEWRLLKWMGSPLETSDISVGWKVSESARGRLSDSTEFPTTTYSWQPRWNGRLRNGMDTTLTVQLSGETQESPAQGALERRNNTVSLRLDQRFDARGRLAFLRFGKAGVGSTIDMTLTVAWSNTTSWREQESQRSQERSTSRISVDPQFTYQFTQNIRGSLRLQYSRIAQTVSTSQSLGMFLDATLNF